MATKTFSGQLDQAIEGAASGNKLLFVPQENLGEVLMGAASEMVVGDDGTYSITLAYNTYSVYHYSDVTKNKILIADGVEVSASTSVSTIPDLIGVSVPVTDSDALTNQGYLQEGQDYAASAKESAEDSDELFNSFGLRVGQAIEPIETGVPSLDIPFNDSGILKKGVGTQYVSGLPVYGVDFTRSSTIYCLDKSGWLSEVQADTIGIGSDGAVLSRPFTALNTYSHDLTNWGSSDSSISITTDGTTCPIDGYSDAVLVTPSSGASQARIAPPSFTSSTGYLSVSVITKENDNGNEIRVRVDGGSYGQVQAAFSFDAMSGYEATSTGGFSHTTYKGMADGFYEVIFYFYSDTYTQLLFYPIGVSTGDGVNGRYVGNIVAMSSWVEGGTMVTETTSSTVTTTTTTVKNNISEYRGGFTLKMDIKSSFFVDQIASTPFRSTAFEMSNGGILQRRQATATYGNDIVLSLGASSSAANVLNVDAGDYGLEKYNKYRHVISVGEVSDGYADVKWYINGELATSGNIPVDVIEPDDLFYIGSEAGGTSAINGSIKNFEALPYTASADEIASLGAPK